MVDISIIIVSYNTAGLLSACLKSLMHPTQARIEVIVVDNASDDNSATLVADDFSWVRLISNKRNLGFSRANNQGLQVAKGDYIFFLNPDTVVMPGVFEAMLKFMALQKEVGLAGTKLINPDGSPQSSVETKYPGQRKAKRDLSGLKGEIAWVLGASMIARRGVIEKLGGFDERFFLYGEEQDLCLRIRKAGWVIGYVPDAVVVHWGGQSERRSPTAEVWKKKFAAETLFYGIHYSRRSIKKIHRKNIIQALWRVFTLRLTLFFQSDKRASLEKLNKYQLALRVFRFWNPS